MNLYRLSCTGSHVPKESVPSRVENRECSSRCTGCGKHVSLGTIEIQTGVSHVTPIPTWNAHRVIGARQVVGNCKRLNDVADSHSKSVK